MLRDLIFSAVSFSLLIAALTDLKTRTISNSVSVVVIVLSFLAAWDRGGLSASIFVFFILAPVFYLLWILRVFGGGDVKLLISLIPLVPPGRLFSLFFTIALVGAILAVVYITRFMALGLSRRNQINVKYSRDKQLNSVASRLPELPYGVAIAVGTIINITHFIG
ncbi:prepilin peptidase [Acetobacter oeni]|uniref:Prepilin type IV endopeptidase peptidase domain-containing protein n=1 Tax=Acetobacter oeni TaxID=304077 RepID=A0A511XIM6_9PROT|nr:prepilin peptidase [Acetobacter oeni]MBB3881907.1 prepilin peptidase CpaA [Acetobacter oeni]NHO17770.1 hypothetical protein [Acetobacter oeni]GEN62799.1 hypothetical protein AOE01nite_10230 [Acetobacter oeni]